MKDTIEEVNEDEPLPTPDGRFHPLDIYSSAFCDAVGYIHDQSILRLKSAAIRTRDPVEEGELEYYIENMRRSGKEELSAMLFGALLVSVYFSYESSIRNAFDVISNKFGYEDFDRWVIDNKKILSRKYKKNPNFLIYAHEYSISTINYGVFHNQEQFWIIDMLRNLRNSYSHNGCRVDNRILCLKESIGNIEHKSILEFNAEKWIATPKALNFFLSECKKSYGHLRNYVIERMLEGQDIL